jgi:putative DNA methylase
MTDAPYKKKLIEVAIPLEAINAASAREKSIRHGHPSTLHLWWARRPLAACRAVLFAQLVDDPSGHPDKFPTEEEVEAERKRLFGIIEELVIWENSTNEEVLERARAEIRNSCDGELPPVYDPFSGGGSIPLEAQRLGLPAYGSDLNPVAVMIGKAMIEIPPKFKDRSPIHPGVKERQFYRNAEGLAEDVKYYGEWMREKAFERIGHLYPKIDLPKESGGGKATVIAWIWARTVPSPDPAFSGVHVPLVRSFDLSSKKGSEVWVEPVIKGKDYRFEIRSKANGDKRHDLEGTVGRQGGICIVSRAAMPLNYIREQGRSGNMRQRLMAMVMKGPRGRIYLPPSDEQEALAFSAQPDSKSETPLPKNPRDFKTPNYGMSTFGDLFTDRQLVALNTFSDLLHEARQQIEHDAKGAGCSPDITPLRDSGAGARAYSEAVSVYLCFGISKLTNLGSTITSWMSDRGALRETFARQAIPMVWDFAEVNFFSNSGGNWSTPIDKISKVVADLPANSNGSITQVNAGDVRYLPGTVISCDPPYYDNIGYADLSDFFFYWLRRGLREDYPEIFGVLETPKGEELVATPYRHGGKESAEKFFLEGMTQAIRRMAEASSDHFPTTIYYAFKQSEVEQEGISSTGWVAFLQAVISSGFAVVGTWPVRTESPGRLIAKGTNALSNSVVLVCRRKEDTALVISRAEFIRALKRDLFPAISDLQAANIAPADMPQSAIGPGIGVFSRCKAVLEADDSEMSVKTALQLINAQLDEYFNETQGEFDADTRFALTWFEQHGYEAGEFGSANSIAQARGISVESVADAGIVESSAGKVRILTREELLDDWDLISDGHFTIWEGCQYLILAQQNDGEEAAAIILKQMGGANAEAVKELAYVLYDIAGNKRNDSKEATAYNGLIAAWSDLTNLATTVPDNPAEAQRRLDL